MPDRSWRFPLALQACYLAVFATCAVNPYDRTVWVAENVPIVLIVVAVALVSRWYRFSNTAYAMMTVLPILHTIGGHYTFELVPFGFVTDLFGFSRNHFDRVAHFTVGFYAYPLAELFLRRDLVRGWFLILALPVLVILAVAGAYEIFEWLYAVSADPAAGNAVLGSQGDVWDAQKDMLADTLGAIAVVALFALVTYRRPSR